MKGTAMGGVWFTFGALFAVVCCGIYGAVYDFGGWWLEERRKR